MTMSYSSNKGTSVKQFYFSMLGDAIFCLPANKKIMEKPPKSHAAPFFYSKQFAKTFDDHHIAHRI